MIGWIDGGAGASGDMLLGAVVANGVPLDVIARAVDPLELGIGFRVEQVTRAGLAATRVHVEVPETRTFRHLADIVDLFTVLDDPLRTRATAVLRRLAEAEATVHGSTVDEVHFHEVGALDSIADIVGVCAGFEHLALDEVHCSTLSLGSGTTRGEHGPIPIPVPAVLALLNGIAPVAAGPAPFESTTPTGAALLAEWVTSWGPLPTGVITSSGGGAGAMDSDVVANVCRLVLAERDGADASAETEVAVQFDTNIDDLDPRVWPSVIAAVLDAGAHDAWLTPVVMKKGRSAHTFSVLCPPDRLGALQRIVFEQTSTIGLRTHLVERTVLDRQMVSVDLDGHAISVKIATFAGKIVNRSVEWDDVERAAAALGRPPADVLAAANALALAL